MITAEEALAMVREHALALSSIEIPLDTASGKILREPLYADRDFPPYNRVTMDGIALAYTDYATGQRTFPIDGIGAAGAPQKQLTQPGHCLEIMTGAILPNGTDTVVRYEDGELPSIAEAPTYVVSRTMRRLRSSPLCVNAT